MALIWILHIAIASGICMLLLGRRQPLNYLYMMLALGFSHTFYRGIEFVPGVTDFRETGTPLSLLYGPLLYLVYRANTGRAAGKTEILLHSIPFIFSTLLYLFWGGLFGSDMSMPLFNYDTTCLLAMASFIIYPLYIETEKRRNCYAEKDVFLASLNGQLSVVYLLSALLLGLFVIEARIPDIDFGINMHVLIFVMLSAAFTLVMRYMFLKSRSRRAARPQPERIAQVPAAGAPEADRRPYGKSQLSSELLDEYTQTVHETLQREQLFLNPNLSLEMLSRKTGIAQHHLSQVFTVHECKNFYKVVAEYRIAYAQERMRIFGGEELTIESLAYECGFNSKTSFNQYFKSKTGITPSEYRGQYVPEAV